MRAMASRRRLRRAHAGSSHRLTTWYLRQEKLRERQARRMLAKDPSALAEQALLPSVRDPRLWMVMCKVRGVGRRAGAAVRLPPVHHHLVLGTCSWEVSKRS